MLTGDLIAAVGGRLLNGTADIEFHGAAVDSRAIKGGELFIAMPGERTDGHAYVGRALVAGAAAVLVAREGDWDVPPGRAVILVSDTLAALQDGALELRLGWKGRMVGITGSVGKTGTREICASILARRYRVHRNEKNYNNEIGVPLTLLSLGDSEAAAVEMGMRARGEIANLARLVRPEVGIVTCIGETHIENLGSLEDIARAKGELLQALPPEGTAVLPAEDPFLPLLKSLSPCPVITFGLGADADVRAEKMVLSEGTASFRLCRGTESAEVVLPLPGRHNVLNALAASTAALALGLDLQECSAGMAEAAGTPMRLEFLEAPGGLKVLCDVYNASPMSVRAAIDVLASCRADRRIAVLADMLELGQGSESMHAGIGEYLVDSGVELLFLYGEQARHIGVGARRSGMPADCIRFFPEKGALVRELKETALQGDMVLVKGSRGMAMEDVVKALVGEGCRGKEAV